MSTSTHIDVRYHWICDALDAKLLELAKVPTDDNDANMMTKALPKREVGTLIVGSTYIVLHLDHLSLELKVHFTLYRKREYVEKDKEALEYVNPNRIHYNV
ncbi:hypothetical protein CR513_33942, partial [Mucuna pruriens]